MKHTSLKLELGVVDCCCNHKWCATSDGIFHVFNRCKNCLPASNVMWRCWLSLLAVDDIVDMLEQIKLITASRIHGCSNGHMPRRLTIFVRIKSRRVVWIAMVVIVDCSVWAMKRRMRFVERSCWSDRDVEVAKRINRSASSSVCNAESTCSNVDSVDQYLYLVFSLKWTSNGCWQDVQSKGLRVVVRSSTGTTSLTGSSRGLIQPEQRHRGIEHWENEESNSTLRARGQKRMLFRLLWNRGAFEVELRSTIYIWNRTVNLSHSMICSQE